MTPKQVALLLEEPCVRFGFCLPPDAQSRMEEKQEADVDMFTDDVIRAEGLNPNLDISSKLRREIRETVLRHFKAAGNDTLLEPPGR